MAADKKSERVKLSQDIEKKQFPRSASNYEKKILFSVLPSHKKGYKEYRDKIEELSIIGFGRFGINNYMLGPAESKPDLTIPSSPIHAIGGNIFKEGELYITIHEESFGQIEFDYNVIKGKIEDYDAEPERIWTLSTWEPGENDPQKGSAVREVHLVENSIVLVFAKSINRIWLYSSERDINYIIPISNYYNELMRVKNIRDPKVALNVKRLFKDLDSYNDDELIQGFLSYNRYLRKIKLNLKRETENKKISRFKMFKFPKKRK